jgi:hypothetical protein
MLTVYENEVLKRKSETDESETNRTLESRAK